MRIDPNVSVGLPGAPSPAQRAESAARDFQALLLGEVVRSMRATVPEGGPWGGGHAQKTMDVFLNRHLSEILSRHLGGDLSDQLKEAILEDAHQR